MPVKFPDLPPAPAPKPTGALRRISRRLGMRRRGEALLKTLLDPQSVARARDADRDVALRRAAIETPDVLLATMRAERERAPQALFPAQAEALLTARTAGWAAALPLFRAIAAEPLDGPGAGSLLAPPRPYPAASLVVPVASRPVDLPPEAAAKIVVYTVAAGGRPPLHPILAKPAGLRFICFTDQDLAVPGWEIRPLGSGNAAFHKICPHEVLRGTAPDAEFSLYVAPDRLLVGNLDTLFTRWLVHSPFATWRHGESPDWTDLAERRAIGRAPTAAAVLTQAEACAAAAVSRDQGLHDTGLLWRRHGDPAVVRLMETWWRCEEEAPGADEMSLCRAEHAVGTAPDILPAGLGSEGLNIFFGRYTRPPVPRPDSPSLRAARIPIAFVYHDRWRDHGITIMRGRQLSRMIAERYPDRFEVTYTADLDAVRDQMVIVNRGALQGYTVEELAGLKARNALLVSDWLDLPVVTETNRLFDAHLAMSPLQALDMSRRYPDAPCFYVTHHVNPDVPHSTPPTDQLRTGYFGLLDNTVLPGALTGAVELVSAVDSSFTARHWQEAAPRFNCHWIVRRISQWEWHKPFLKGFVAARCGAAVIVTRDDLNASFYLGDDYPFYAESLDPADLEMTWLRAESGFGGPDWVMALDIMKQVAARSTEEQVCTEFRFMLDELLR